MAEEVGNELTAKQLKVIANLAGGSTVDRAAADAGVTSRTVRRWRNDDWRFVKALLEQQNAVRQQVTDDLLQASLAAVRTLASIASDISHPQSLRAAQLILDRVSLNQIPGPVMPAFFMRYPLNS